jgi:hypothetical protein
LIQKENKKNMGGELGELPFPPRAKQNKKTREKRGCREVKEGRKEGVQPTIGYLQTI